MRIVRTTCREGTGSLIKNKSSHLHTVQDIPFYHPFVELSLQEKYMPNSNQRLNGQGKEKDDEGQPCLVPYQWEAHHQNATTFFASNKNMNAAYL